MMTKSAQGAFLRVADASVDPPAGDQDRFDAAMRLKVDGRAGEAIAILSLLADDPRSFLRFHATLELATCLRLAGREAESEDQLAVAAGLDDGSHWPIAGRLDILLGQGRTEDALDLIEAAYHRLRPDGKASLAQRRAGLLATCHADRARSLVVNEPHRPGPVPALARAGIMMMVKDEADILSQNLEHHYALGFRSYCILDNGSTDASAALVGAFRERHPDALVLSVFDQIVGYYQSAKMAVFQDALHRYAAIAGIALDWLFFIDADEFIAFSGSDDAAGCQALDEVLTDPDASLLIMHWVNAATPDILRSVPLDADPLRTFTRRMSSLQPVVPKIAIRIGSGLQPMMGNHFIENYGLPLASTRVLATMDWYMLHFPLRSLDHVRSKVINGGRAFQNASGLETHGGHWRARYDQYVRHGDGVLQQILRQHIDSVT